MFMRTLHETAGDAVLSPPGIGDDLGVHDEPGGRRLGLIESINEARR
jgi:hypothetical protein